MAIHIELSPEIEAHLAAEALAHGVPLEEYAGEILQRAATPYATGTGILRPGDIAAMTRIMTEGHEHLPVLPPQATERESFYEDRW